MWVLLFRLRRCVWDGGSLGRQGAYPMPLYRYARDNLLENAWGDNPRAYPERFTIVRETTSLGGERAQQAAYSLPSQRFSLALSFPHSPLSLGKRPLVCVLRISCARLVHFRSAEHRGNVQSMTVPQGGWGRRKVGDWGRKPRRGRGISIFDATPFPWVVSPSSGKPVLRECSTQNKWNRK